ncbi:hypothetical protein [Candidatus Poriferisocius sp.]|uniref:hypothetical protein n=1 Tax=Candidatus Poriferisocius sp. TaxID=3101276 RepID=UPI003B5CE62D
MPNTQVGDDSEHVYWTWLLRAKRGGPSSQEQLSEQPTEMASQPTVEEVFERIEGQNLGQVSGEDVVAALDAERARR